MENTKISSSKTSAQITSLLGEAGASGVQLKYENGEVSGLAFFIPINGNDIYFILPVRTRPIFEYLQEKRKRYQQSNSLSDQEKANRIAWRQIYRWIQAQLALIQTGMVKTEEVFLPYMQADREGRTLFMKIEQNGFTMITDGRK
jgi:hypothetical protein